MPLQIEGADQIELSTAVELNKRTPEDQLAVSDFDNFKMVEAANLTLTALIYMEILSGVIKEPSCLCYKAVVDCEI